MKEAKLIVIKCPNCGYEYLPSEIFIPDALLGHPHDIVRDEFGKIIEFQGTSADIHEQYCCDNCDAKFRIAARMIFTPALEKNEVFEEEYVSPLNQETLMLEEVEEVSE